MSAPYRVKLGSTARRQLRRLPPKVAGAVLDFVAVALSEDPYRLSKPLRGELDGLRSARRGDYRVLLSVDESASSVLVVRIAHRSDVYRP